MLSDKLEKTLFRKVELWIVLLLLLAGGILLVLFGWAVKQGVTAAAEDGASGSLAVEVASLPDYTLQLLDSGLAVSDGGLVQRNTQIIDYDGPIGFDDRDPSFSDDGILLVSAYSDAHGISTVYLYDLARQERLWEWVPDHAAIVEMTPSLRKYRDAGQPVPGEDNRANFRTQHPYLLDDGSVVFTSGEGVLARMDAHGNILWTSDRHYHHSIERMPDGNFIVPTVLRNNSIDMRDDAFAIVSPDGEVVAERSIAGILLRNGYQGLLFGIGTWETDRTHLNDADPIYESDEYVQRGDIAFSLRHLSTVFLYRPSTDRVVWLQIGPWITQHDIDYLGNGRFSVFGNDYVRGRGWLEFGNSNIYTTSMADRQVGKPFGGLFERLTLQTETQGLQRLLANGDAFVSLTDAHKLMRLNDDRVRWTYTSPLETDNAVGALHWSRYYRRDELDLGWLNRLADNRE